MDPKNAADFDDSMATLAKIRNQPTLVSRADAVAVELMPLVEAALAEGFQVAAAEIPGGPLLAMGLHVVQPIIENSIRAWVARYAAGSSSSPGSPATPG